jgi:hypothetical protein
LFVDLVLVFDSRPVHLVKNRFKDCRWSLKGTAGVTLDFIAGLCRGGGTLQAIFAQEPGLLGEEAWEHSP